jgi:phage shock protein PspC (stress-responsive transcriptional regulator)
MLGRLARVTYMLTVAAMIVAWAMMPSRSSPVEPTHEQVVETWYC